MDEAGPSRHTLIIGPSWVGDMVMAQALFTTLKAQDPGMTIDVLAPAWSHPLTARMPEVRRAVAMPLGHGRLGLFSRFRLGRSLQDQYDRAIVLPNSFKSALVPFHARISERTGFLGELRWGLLTDPRRLDKKRLPRTVDRFVALGLPPDAPLPDPVPPPRLDSDPEQGRRVLEKHRLPADGTPLLLLCPGAAYGPAKAWPLDHFARVGAAMAGRGWRVLTLGSAGDRDAGARITAAIDPAEQGRAVNLAGVTSLEEAVDLLALAAAVVSNDSGLMHVAAALDRPLVALFGSSDPGHTPPMGRRSRALSLGLSCAPCFRRVCPEGHLDCLRHLTPAMVLEQLDGLTAP